MFQEAPSIMKMSFAAYRPPNPARPPRRKIVSDLCLVLLTVLVLLYALPTPAFSTQADQSLESQYNQLRQTFQSLEKSSQKGNRLNWQPVIQGFKQIYMQYPESIWGEKSMFMVGRIYYILYQTEGSEADLLQFGDRDANSSIPA